MILDEDKRHAARVEFDRNLRPILEVGNKDGAVSDIAINGDVVWIYRGEERIKKALDEFTFVGNGKPMANSDVQGAAKNAARYSAQEFGPASPLLSVKIPPHYRATFVMPSVGDKWYADIRFLPREWIALESYVEREIMSPMQLSEVRDVIKGRKNVIVSGATGAGKTTLLRAMIGEMPKDERLLVLEDVQELNLPGDAVVSLATTRDVDLAALVRHTLRLTPDRIVLGEVRGNEALELITAMNTGHSGTLCTLHSDGGRDALRRLHNLVRRTAPNALIDEIECAVDVVIQIEGKGRERRLKDIWEVPRHAT